MEGERTAVLSRSTSVDATIDVGPAVGTWAITWVLGNVVAAPLILIAMGASLGDELTIPQLTAVSVGVWAIFAIGLFFASRRFGSGSFVTDYAVGFRPIDLIGVPVGVVTQVALIPLLYLPLRGIWPDTFSDERIEERAQELADRAGGWSTVLLVLVVVVGAPIVEELVYRGLLQRSTSRAIGVAGGLVITSLFFALIHFSPVEYPGLFVAGLVFGACVVVTGRIGPAIVTHAAFNATGLWFVLQSG